MRFVRVQSRYVLRYVSADARYVVESIGHESTCWCVYRRCDGGSQRLGVFDSLRAAVSGAETDATTTSCSSMQESTAEAHRRSA